MKRYITMTIVLMTLSTGFLHSQTYIKVGGGVRFSDIISYSSTEHPYGADILSDGFESRNPVLGLGLAHYFTDRLKLDVALHYGVQSIGYTDNDFVGWTDLRFDHYEISAVPGYKIFRDMWIGFGVSYNILSDYEVGKKDRDLWASMGETNHQKHLGWIASLSYELQPVTIELHYHHTSGENVTKRKLINHINSIEVLLSYRLSITKQD